MPTTDYNVPDKQTNNRFGFDVTKGVTVKEGYYTQSQVQQMRDVLADAQIINSSVSVTFPVRAVLCTAPETLQNLQWLLQQVCYLIKRCWKDSFGTKLK